MQQRVLIADDDPDICDIIAEGLNVYGHQCRVATDGHDAIALIKAWEPQLVVLDIVLPHINGEAILRELRQSHPQTSVIAISGYSEVDGASLYNADVHGFFRKPFETKEFFAACNRFLKFGGSGPSSPYKLLSPRERDVLEEIKQGQTSEAIAASLNISKRTVEGYRNSIRRKFNAVNTAELLTKAQRDEDD